MGPNGARCPEHSCQNDGYLGPRVTAAQPAARPHTRKQAMLSAACEARERARVSHQPRPGAQLSGAFSRESVGAGAGPRAFSCSCVADRAARGQTARLSRFAHIVVRAAASGLRLRRESPLFSPNPPNLPEIASSSSEHSARRWATLPTRQPLRSGHIRSLVPSSAAMTSLESDCPVGWRAGRRAPGEVVRRASCPPSAPQRTTERDMHARMHVS